MIRVKIKGTINPRHLPRLVDSLEQLGSNVQVESIFDSNLAIAQIDLRHTANTNDVEAHVLRWCCFSYLRTKLSGNGFHAITELSCEPVPGYEEGFDRQLCLAELEGLFFYHKKKEALEPPVSIVSEVSFRYFDQGAAS